MEWPAGSGSAGVAASGVLNDLPQRTKTATLMGRSRCVQNAQSDVAAHVSSFELAKAMGTSVEMAERTYGSLLDGAHTALGEFLVRLSVSCRPSRRPWRSHLEVVTRKAHHSPPRTIPNAGLPAPGPSTRHRP